MSHGRKARLRVAANQRATVVVVGECAAEDRHATLLAVDDRGRCLVEFATGGRCRLPMDDIAFIPKPQPLPKVGKFGRLMEAS